ncbi:hypothetical protein [Streptomyces sp. NPDC093970]|uniref:hypothetical protein n=1 Tax=Streptomyces sp. NPDC093970 TaxID=3155076 RepID=UPI003437FE30
MQAASASVLYSARSSKERFPSLGSILATLFSRSEEVLRQVEVDTPEAFSPELHSLIERTLRFSSGNQALEDTTLRAASASVGLEVLPAPQALQYAEQKMHELTALPVGWDGDDAPPTTLAACKRMMRLLRAVTDGASVYPTLVTDYEGGISAEWRAGKQKAAIEVDADGEAYLYVTDCRGDQVLAERLIASQDAYALIRTFGRELSEMSSRVERVNPAWRSLFE